MPITIDILNAFEGDCILVSFSELDGDTKNLLIDGGTPNTYQRALKDRLQHLGKSEILDRIILTHIDEDHIGGLLKFIEDSDFSKSLIRDFWLNSGNIIHRFLGIKEDLGTDIPINPTTNTSGIIPTSYKQGITLEKYLDQNFFNKTNKSPILSGEEYNLGNARLKILSPQKSTLQELGKKWDDELKKTGIKKTGNKRLDYTKSFAELVINPFENDKSLPNKSSISFIFEFDNKKILLLGDAHAKDVVVGLKKFGYNKRNPLQVDILKLPHHGSKHNFNKELFLAFKCNRYVISSDCYIGLPDKETISKIIHWSRKDEPLEFIFNYPLKNFKNLLDEFKNGFSNVTFSHDKYLNPSLKGIRICL